MNQKTTMSNNTPAHPNNPPGISLQLTLDDINLILEGIGALPFARVFGLVARIQSQAAEQLKAAAPAAATTNPG